MKQLITSILLLSHTSPLAQNDSLTVSALSITLGAVGCFGAFFFIKTVRSLIPSSSSSGKKLIPRGLNLVGKLIIAFLFFGALVFVLFKAAVVFWGGSLAKNVLSVILWAAGCFGVFFCACGIIAAVRLSIESFRGK